MHIPDGFIDGKTAAATALLSAAAVGLALRQVRRRLPPRRVPLLGLAAAFLFAAQMVNFPVAGGTSGHLMGGVLVAALLGPSAAVVVLTTVLIVQCFLFAGRRGAGAGGERLQHGDGGRGGRLRHLPRRRAPGCRARGDRWPRWRLRGGVRRCWPSIGCAGQLAWSGTVAWAAGFTAMAGVHMLIGIGRGRDQRAGVPGHPADAAGTDDVDARRADTCLVGRVGAATACWRSLGLAVFVAPFACPWPDGLESVAARLGFEQQAAASHCCPGPGARLPVCRACNGRPGPRRWRGRWARWSCSLLALLLARCLVVPTRRGGNQDKV